MSVIGYLALSTMVGNVEDKLWR